jgi:hypothetical protein
VADDPSDAFDKFADAIRSTQDELDATDTLRAAKAAEKRKRKPGQATGAPPEPAPRPKDED